MSSKFIVWVVVIAVAFFVWTKFGGQIKTKLGI